MEDELRLGAETWNLAGSYFIQDLNSSDAWAEANSKEELDKLFEESTFQMQQARKAFLCLKFFFLIRNPNLNFKDSRWLFCVQW